MKELEAPSAAAAEVHRVKEDHGARPKTFQRKQGKPKLLSRNCQFCGRKHEANRLKCPAYGEMCHKCNKKGHFTSVCGQMNSSPRKLHQISEDDSCDYYDTIQSVTSEPRKHVC
jgi:hypothetical protein